MFFCKRIAQPQKRSCWIWIARTLRCTGSKNSGFSTATHGHYCYLPLHIVCGGYVLRALAAVEYRSPKAVWGRWSGLWRRSGKCGRKSGSWCAAIRVVFVREELLSWCEAHGGTMWWAWRKNARLLREIATASAQVESQFQQTGKAAPGVSATQLASLYARSEDDKWTVAFLPSKQRQRCLRPRLSQPLCHIAPPRMTKAEQNSKSHEPHSRAALVAGHPLRRPCCGWFAISFNYQR
jgi:hypothetical protein